MKRWQTELGYTFPQDNETRYQREGKVLCVCVCVWREKDESRVSDL